MLNLLAIDAGQVIRLKNGGTAQVLENIGDGLWLNARLPSGDEELVFCEDILGLADAEPTP